MLEFVPETHTYWWDGEWVPSVTSIIQAARLVDDTHFTAFARDRGTAIHAAIEYDIAGDLDEGTVDQWCLPYVEQFRHFRADTKIRILRSECRVYSKKYRYAGTFDLYGVVNGKRIIIDIKTGTVPRTVGMQTAAYFQAAKEQRLRPQARYYLHLQPEWYKLRECKDPMDLERFLDALAAFYK
jgi:hypothetical protein